MTKKHEKKLLHHLFDNLPMLKEKEQGKWWILANGLFAPVFAFNSQFLKF